MGTVKKLGVWILSLLILSSGLALVFAQKKADHSDKRKILGTNYKITGHIDPLPGQSFPKAWGRLVNYAAASNSGGHLMEQRFVFEAEDGTIRVVKIDLNWRTDSIDDAEVITIGRN